MDNDMLAWQLDKANIELDASNQQQSLDAREQQTPSPPHELITPPTVAQSSPPNNASSNTKNKKLFPQKLWDLINDDKYNFCLRWSDDGQLVYLNRDDFEDSYLKTAENQFHTQKAISFVRQMNMYGFRKVDDCYYENDNFKRDCEHLLKNMIRKHPNKNPISNPADMTSEQSAFLGGSPLYGSFNINLKTANANAQLSKQDALSTTDLSPMNQRQNFQSLYNDQKEFIMTQQSDTQCPRDLSMASKANNNSLDIQQSDHNNLSAFYALLSSLNSNLCQPTAQIQANQNFAFDINRYLQNIYQQILTTSAATPLETKTSTTPSAHTWLNPPSPSSVPVNYGPNSSFVAQNSTTHQQQSSAPTMRMNDLALHTSTSDKDLSSTSLLARNKFSINATKSSRSLEIFENGCRNGYQIGERSRERNRDNRQQQLNNSNPLGKLISDSESLATERREIKSSTSNRSFKRSIDSILDTNNNSNISTERRATLDVHKRIKIELDPEESTDDDSIENGVAKMFAERLVAQVALSKDKYINESVISAATGFTQRFVETLFDTAQVIARHSNGSGSSSEDTDLKPTREIERSGAISINDLTSALKLLPSKISYLLK